MSVDVRFSSSRDAEAVSEVLVAAAQWLIDQGMPLWPPEQFALERIREAVAAGVFVVAEVGSEVVGVCNVGAEDRDMWPDVPLGESLIVHSLAVRREFAGGSVSAALLGWVVEEARRLGRRFVRLDCDATRPRLRRVYEDLAFRRVEDIQVGPYLCARFEFDVGTGSVTSGAAV